MRYFSAIKSVIETVSSTIKYMATPIPSPPNIRGSNSCLYFGYLSMICKIFSVQFYCEHSSIVPLRRFDLYDRRRVCLHAQIPKVFGNNVWRHHLSDLRNSQHVPYTSAKLPMKQSKSRCLRLLCTSTQTKQTDSCFKRDISSKCYVNF